MAREIERYLRTEKTEVDTSYGDINISGCCSNFVPLNRVKVARNGPTVRVPEVTLSISGFLQMTGNKIVFAQIRNRILYYIETPCC